ncbi:MAG TPA: ATP-dependent helicase [Chiayiivirga sp.]|nr:ATP-dependent helicase [Chiayiivirga sp.]
MDAFTSVRLKAQQVRQRLQEKTSCGQAAPALLKAAMGDAELTVLHVPADYPLLGGGMGALQRTSQRITLSNALDPEAKVFVQAHEFGHWVIESPADPVLVSFDVDPEGPEQATPLGTGRVEGYSAQEMRERYANVFAREFLLPVDLARHLFVERQWPASKIASELGIASGLVYQQLQYALLVPDPQPASPDRPLTGLDPSQRIAAHHVGTPALVEAGPGTGKTRTLIGRIEHLLEAGTDPRSILALTFSNKAAREIKERIARTIPAANELWAGTFHAFGLELLRKHAVQAGLPEPVRVVDPADALERLEAVLPSLELHYYLRLNDPLAQIQPVLGAISRAKDELCTPAQYAAFAAQMAQGAQTDAEREAAERADEVARIYARYESMLEEAGAVDFGDLIWRAIRLLEDHPEVLAAVRDQFTHVLVDEYQDVNRASSRLLKLIAGDGERLWVVGDVRQAIYRFRGASPGNMRLFTSEYPGAKVLPLECNYRSGQRIIDTYTTFARSLDDAVWRAATQLKADRGDGHRPQLLIAPDLDSEVSAIAQAIEAHRQQGVGYRDQAIIVRTHTHAERIAMRLQALGVPSMYLGDIFERAEVRDLLALISFVAEPSRGALLRLAATGAYGMPLEDVRTFLQHAHATQRMPLAALSDPAVVAACSPAGRTALERLRDDLAGVSFESTVPQVLHHVLFERRALVDALLEGDGSAAQQRRLAVFQLLQFAAEHFDPRKGNSKKNLLRWIRRLEQFGEERALRELPAAAASIDAVRLMTVHASKGLEFPVVYLPYLATTHFPQSGRYVPCPPPTGMLRAEDVSDRFEEESLFYVALSRARDHLHLSRSQRLGARNASESKFLPSIVGQVARTDAPQCAPLPIADELPARPELKLEPSIHEARELEQYERCPRKYAYSRSLGLHASGDDDGYARFHRSVYAVLSWVLQQRQTRDVPLEEYWPQLEQVWATQGPGAHPFSPVYKDFAVRLLTKAQEHLRAPGATSQPVEMDLGGVRVRVELDQTEPGNGGLVRRYKTGRRPKKVKVELPETLRLLAGQQLYGKGARLQMHYLTSGDTVDLEITGKQLDATVAEVRTIANAIAAGEFPPNIGDQCPRCPFFFLCPAIPPVAVAL